MEIVSVIGAAWVICSVGRFEVSYPHYIDRVYGTNAGPLSDCDPGIVVMLFSLLCCILVVRMVYASDRLGRYPG